MMNFVLYMIFSIMDTSALFYLALKLFKIDIYFKEMIFASTMMAFVSFVVRMEHGHSFTDVFLQYILFVCFLWMLFRIHIFYAVILAGTAMQAFMLIQSLIYLLINFTGLYHLNFPVISTGIYLMQVLSDSLIVLLAYGIGSRRKGFDYIPDKPDGRLNLEGRDLILFALSIPSFGAFLINIYLTEHLYEFSIFIPVVYGSVLLGYLYFSTKKDRGDLI